MSEYGSTPTMWAIDVDHTQLDTDLVFDEIAQVCEREGIVTAQGISEARDAVEATSGTFDTMGFLSCQYNVTDSEIDTISRIVGDNTDEKEYLYSDTLELLQYLDDLEMPSFSLTWGASKTQMPKLRATKLNRRPYVITDEKEKGKLISTWRTPEGMYKVRAAAGELLMSTTGVLIDDKASSFIDLPEDWKGYLVQRKAPKPSQMGSIPWNVDRVKDLSTITSILRSTYSVN